ncbi:adenylyl-sulfate kinase [Flavobacterium artemisiae]|uniref:adenylyl-sulfate kinase n=1 Tax=Flavobacterium artemisiae TaxID=2126556 RepID=A0ABW4HBX3_9FLAO
MILIQFTGLSGSGKTTLAENVSAMLLENGYQVKIVDGDVYRKTVCKDLGFSKEDRYENVRRLFNISRDFVASNYIVLMSVINPFEDLRNEIAQSEFVKTVFLDCHIDALINRDPKGLYQKALLPDHDVNKIKNFTGISDVYEVPSNADLILKTDSEPVSDSTQKLYQFIIDNLVTNPSEFKLMNPSSSQLPISFSIEKLQHDLSICENLLWTPHFNTGRYEGNWTSVSLRSQSGKETDILSFPDREYKNTPLLDKCSYFKEIMDWFECEKEAVRLLRLGPESEIKEHVDNDTSYEDGFFRIHIPIITNSEVFFYVDKKRVKMEMGECWYANFQLPHSVQNKSTEPRIHLTLDCIRNEWSDELFSKMGFDIHYVPSNDEFSEEVKQRIIAELSRNPSETNAKIIADLQSK